ncbi:uncharacterized protein F54H12.2-like [Mercenaria mercenaria]|uniref:uncharacterized protein F54H12.2-like n=1 Tax=Mercenaria mercenaria TaxID=6596 RepID=UPI00234EDC05|nr:uncharacterized protein F54H12.2-like [Mercenaria mercenaria]
MAFLNISNQDVAYTPGLQIFATRQNQVAIENIRFVECQPISSISTEGSPVEIQIPGAGQEYLDLQRSRLYVKAKLLKHDGSHLTALEKTSIINLPSLNTNNYPWKAYIKTLMSTSHDDLQQLESQLYYPDDPNLDETDPVSGSNGGLIKRGTFTKSSVEFELEGPLMEDIFSIDKYMINGVDINLKLYRSNNTFMCMSKEASPDYKLVLLNVLFKACKVRVDPGVYLAHEKQIQIAPAQYPMLKNEVKMNSISTNSSEFLWDNLFQNALPNKVIIGFVNQQVVNRSYVHNPFNFIHSNVTSIGLYVDGVSVPSRPLQLDFDKNQFVSAYLNLFDCAESKQNRTGLTIERSYFPNGYSLFCFVIEPNNLGGKYLNLVKTGHTLLEVRFKTPTSVPISCLMLAEFPTLLQIDQFRDVRFIQP